MEFNVSVENSTGLVIESIVGEHEEGLKIALEVLLVALLAFVMLAMGCDITWSDLWVHLRHPTGVLIGMASQFGVLPLCAFALSQILQLTVYQSLSLLILSCCPGGVVSNLFTMWCNGNVSLSICMTTMSTIMALGMMPLNLLVYMLNWDTEGVLVPYDKLATTLVTIFIPVLIGVSIRTKFPRAAPWVIRGGSTAGFLSIIGSIVIQSLLIPGLFECSWKSYFSAFMLPFLGFGFGFGCAYVTKMSYRNCRTIAFETGSQNVPLALTITLLSFPFEKQKEMAPIPMLFAIFIHIEAIIISLTYYWWRKKKAREASSKIAIDVIETEEKTTMIQNGVKLVKFKDGDIV